MHMNRILILDLTANDQKWEFSTASEQQKLLNDLGLTVHIELFDEVVRRLELLETIKGSSSDFNDEVYQIQKLYQEKCREINTLLDQIDYVNIRCHGELDDHNQAFADIFCCKSRKLEDFSIIANFDILLQLIPNLKNKDIFFTVCYGGGAIQPFTFNGLDPVNHNYIYSMVPMSIGLSRVALTNYVKRQSQIDESPKVSFINVFDSLKTCLYTVDRSLRELILTNVFHYLSLPTSTFTKLVDGIGWTQFVDQYLVSFLNMENPEEIFERI